MLYGDIEVIEVNLKRRPKFKLGDKVRVLEGAEIGEVRKISRLGKITIYDVMFRHQVMTLGEGLMEKV